MTSAGQLRQDEKPVRFNPRLLDALRNEAKVVPLNIRINLLILKVFIYLNRFLSEYFCTPCDIFGFYSYKEKWLFTLHNFKWRR